MRKRIIAGMVALTAGSLLSSTFQASSLNSSRAQTSLGSGLMPNARKSQNCLGAELDNNSNLTKLQLPIPENSKEGFKNRFEDPNANIKIVERLKNRLKDARANTKIIEGEDFSKMDLRDFDLNDLGFINCNFSGAKFPSLDSVDFYNSCNLENADFSNIVLKKVNFGDRIYENQINELIALTGKNQLLINEIEEFNNSTNIKYFQNNTYVNNSMPLKEIQSNIEDLTAKTKKEPKILKITNANFAGTKFKNLWSYNSDFSGSNFNNAEIRIDQASIDEISIYIPSVTGLDLTGAIFKFYDNRGREVQQTRGTKQLNLESIEGLKRIGNNGVVSEDYLNKWKSDKEIKIFLNAKEDEIPLGLKIQNISNKYKSLPQPSEYINDIESYGAKICNQFFGRYKIKFVTNETIEAKEADYNLHFNFINSELSGGTEFTNFFALGNKNHVVTFNQNKINGDFWSVFLHEMTHMFFKDPAKQSDLFYPAQLSYLPPMANRPDPNGDFFSNNMMPIVGPSIWEQKLLQEYMSLHGRKPEITADLSIKYNPKTLGIRSSYNPDKNFKNIVEISSKDLDDENYHIVIDGERALSYCTTSDLYICDPAKGLENSQAIITIDIKTGTVLSMIMLGGENPKIKIDDKIFDVKDFIGKGVYSYLMKDSEGNMVYEKYKEKTDLNPASFVESNYLLKANEKRVKPNEERPSEKTDLTKDLKVNALVASDASVASELRR